MIAKVAFPVVATSGIEIRPDGGPHEAGFLRLECGKLKETCGWEARWHIAEAVRKTADWSRAWLRGEDMIRVTDAQIREFLREDSLNKTKIQQEKEM